MLRCDHNLLFYRVLCAALLMTAFTFTVILTNVFIDIDWFLSNKNKHNTQIADHSKIAPKDYDYDGSETEGRNEDNSYESENIPFYRTRRSIDSDNRLANRAHDGKYLKLLITDSHNIQLHVKDPGLKKILTSRLASLLKELDEEETTIEVKTESTTATSVKAFERLQERDNMVDRVSDTDVFHLAMHNILLQGMLGHMDLNDVFNRVHRLVNGFNDSVKYNGKTRNDLDINNDDINSRTLNAITNSKEQKTKNSNPYNEESKLIAELINCKKLESEVARNKLLNNRITAKGDAIKKDNKIFINAVIEINEDYGKVNKINLTNATDNVKGDVKLIYNGKAVDVNQIDETNNDNTVKKNQDGDVEIITIFNENKRMKEPATIKTTPKYTRKQNQNSLLNKLIEEYFKTRSPIDYLDSGEMKRFQSRRLKRQLEMQYEEDQTNSPKSFEENTQKDDDNVYIEIETHFRRKGIKGDKKQKIVKTLIDKIQKALRSDIHETDHVIKNIKFVKRTQDPIDGKHILINKIPPPHDRIEPRQLDPIDKTLSDNKNEVKAIDDSWTNQIETPKFLSTSKSVNSAEMRELNINYDNVLRNGIPKRLQKPINTDTDEDDQTITPFIDNEHGNVTLLLKDIDGTGFSIGINQYVGEPPDINSMKIFNGLESLIKEYHQSYDQDVSNESDIDKAENFVQNNNNFVKKSIRNGHNVLKRSIKGIGLSYKNISLDKYSKPYKYNYDKLLFKLQKYLNNRNTNNTNKKSIYLFLKKIKLTKMPAVDNNSLNKNSSGILKLNSLISRNKRSLTVKKISNVNSKIKLSKYINTNARTYKRILLNNNKRNKRQINKIRIIARESQNPDRNSDENIFRMSGENPYSDKRTVIKEFETPDTVINARNHYDDVYPMGDYFRIQHHTEPKYSNFYDKIGSDLHISKYPHIFINDDIASKEEFTGNKMYGLNEAPNIIQSIPKNVEQETLKIDTQTVSSESIPNVEEIINAIMPSASKPNYKLTVKISPKNPLNISKGFKEVHTSVNKTFDENGLRYFTLFNLSHISKIEELNQTTVLKNDKTNVKQSNDKAKEKFHIKKLLQLHKKRVDQQLNSLVRESKHLEAMIDGHSTEDINKTINTLQDDIVASDLSNDEKMNKILASIKKLQDSYNLITNDIRKQTSLVTDKPKKSSETPVIHTVEYNDKITNEILKKIDANTDILKRFLEKISDNFKPKIDEPKAVERMTVNPAEIRLNFANDWKRSNNKVFYGPRENKNATIPLVYTFQQNKGPQARIYHVHANAIPNDLKQYDLVSKTDPNVFDSLAVIKQNFNGSKFFMDENENDFKVEPNKPFIEANIKINSTTT
ncbi:protein PFF0380w-like [Vanessa cardui]|uniref:protein PFF0380w-like n=1 Tax=Vanessa cardui TaxID=171605 RepID=UPI001F12A94D|nr:protein PFF0380w-like [Vanessa cardui]